MKRTTRIINIGLIVLIILGISGEEKYFSGIFNEYAFKNRPALSLDVHNEVAIRKKIDRKSKKIAHDNPDQFAIYQNAIRTRANRLSHDYNTGYLISEMEKSKRAGISANARKMEYAWTEHGPSNVPGRTRAILVMPGDDLNNTWLAGSAGGGIWKTSDGGITWINKSSQFSNLSVSSLAACESDPDIIYAGTGESFGSGGLIEILGQGMLKSTDGGETWTHLTSTVEQFNQLAINAIIVDPQNPDILLISTNQNIGRGLSFNSGIYKSQDGGNNWNQVYEPPAWIQQIIAEPGNFNVQYAAVYSQGLAKSVDAGETWDLISNGLLPSGRFEIAIGQTNQDLLYASAEGELSGVESDFYISDDGGVNWKLVVEQNDADNRNFFAATPNSSAQGGWNNTIAVNPFNDNIIYVGGVDLYKMTMKEGEKTGDRNFRKVDEDSTDIWMEFVNFASSDGYWNGRLAVGDIPEDRFVTIEIRYGQNAEQMAHRFTVPTDGGTNEDGGAGIADSLYKYEDYVLVPFEVWDIENDRQLMVSFRDQAQNGTWDLIENSTEGIYNEQSREYFFIHDIEYNPTTPDGTVTINGGQTVTQMYFMWPYLKEGAIFDPDNLPVSTLTIDWGEVVKRYRETERMTSWIGAGVETENGRDLPYIHADQHSIIPIVSIGVSGEFKLLMTNDGGIFQSIPSSDPGLGINDWQFAGNGYNTSQFYGVDKKPGGDEFVGGLQDNGSFLSPQSESASKTTEYVEVGGGDGMENVWNYGNEKEIIISIYNNQFSKTTDGGAYWSDANTGLTDVGARAPFISKIGNSKTKPEVLFAVGASGVWKSNNFGDNWILSPIEDNWVLSTTMDVEVSLSNYNIVWAGAGMTDNAKIFVSTDHGITFKAVNNFTDVELGGISGIETHPTEDSTAFVLFSFAGAPKILRTTNMGETWEDISGFGVNDVSNNGFPDVVVHSLIVLPHDTNIIWAGTEIGIFESIDNGGSWSLLQSDFPSASVWDMKQVDNQIVVGTHGRGIWSAAIPDLPEITVTPAISSMGVSPKGELVIQVDFRSAYDSSLVFLNGINQAKIGETQKVQGQVIFDYPVEEIVTSTIHSYVNGLELISNTESIDFFFTEEVADSFGSEFNNLSDGQKFIGNGFSVTTADGFDANDFAIHSKHNYQTDTQYVYTLKTPVKVSESLPNFYYKDIAIVESGEVGTSFGDLEFWDFVVIEGTVDGVNWLPLEDGYDASKNPFWLAAYKNGGEGEENLYIDHNINLLNTFNVGDTVMFRFRLFSDQFSVGWGWVVDDVYIQEEKPVGLEENQLRSISVYPNPFVDKINIDFVIDNASRTDISLTDISGKVLREYNYSSKNSGVQHFEIEATTLKKGIYFARIRNDNRETIVKVIKD